MFRNISHSHSLRCISNLLVLSRFSQFLCVIYIQIQGAIMVASVFQVVIGFSGVMGFVLRFIGPLSITPTIALIGLSLFGTGSFFASQQWWIAIL